MARDLGDRIIAVSTEAEAWTLFSSPGVPDLSARFGVERGDVEDGLAALSGPELAGARPPSLNRATIRASSTLRVQ